MSLAACANEQPEDPLDPALLVQLAEAGGDGDGEALTGRYLLASEVLECDCPQQLGVDLCGSGASALFGLDGPGVLVQVDGWLTFEPEAAAVPWALSGAIGRDGDFALAALSGLAVGLFSVRLYARLDGAFADDRSFSGELAHRILGELPDGPVDCRTALILTGTPAPDA